MSIDSLRIARGSDAEAIAQLVNRAYQPGSGVLGWTHESDLVSGKRTSAKNVTEIISKADSVVLVGLKDAEVVACVHVEKDGQNSYIGMLSVNPIFQCAGAGKAMLAYAEDHAVKNYGSEKFTMVVISLRTELISFYLRRGYKKTGTDIEYRLLAGAGTPKQVGLKVEVLEKTVQAR
jgi:ribosomal protein S18 acetylase RimI-like enzyme